MTDLHPRMRAGDTDRAATVATLGRHLGERRLDVPEFDARVARAYAAVYLDELPPLVADLPPDAPARRPAERRPARRPDLALRALVAVVLALVMAWSVVAVVHGAPPVFAVLLLFVFLRHRRWSRRW